MPAGLFIACIASENCQNISPSAVSQTFFRTKKKTSFPTSSREKERSDTATLQSFHANQTFGFLNFFSC